MKFALIALALVSSVSFAKGSSHPQAGEQQSNGMVPWSAAQRVVTWHSERHWQSADGQILVCPWEARPSHDKECRDKKNDKIDRWIPLTSYAIPGFEIVGFQYFYAGSYGSQQLAVYYGAVKPKSAAPIEALEGKVIPTLNFTGPITIKAGKVIVQRKR